MQPGDWLERHPQRGQADAEWRAARRNLPRRQRTTMQQPLGAFDGLMNGCNLLAEADARHRLAALATECVFTAEAAHGTRCAEALAP